MNLSFTQEGDFEARNAAEEWCKQNGYSYGPTDRTGVSGILKGDFLIAKWFNLTREERAGCDGTITGNQRNGPVFIHIYEPGEKRRLI